ncbi:MAG: peptidyl-prolyl cis-trans isomerase [Myxococcales bacterium]|nr:peptidyl-prolyl cis-trans isomerase [Myxococcales bacterium]
MTRTQSIVAALSAIVLVALLMRVVAEANGPRIKETPVAIVDAGVDAAPSSADAQAAVTPEGGVEPRDGGAVLITDLRDLPEASDGGGTEKAVRQVRFGVVLVQFAGAQGAAAGARSREAAATLAAELGEEAKKDFKAAVRRGDPGSTEDAGRMHRGILEPGPERILFSLAVGDVGGPVETPRGYWIVKRLE